MATVSQLRQVGLRDVYVFGMQDDVDEYLKSQIAAIRSAINAGGIGEYTPKQLEKMLAELLRQIDENFAEFTARSGETATNLALVDVETEAGLVAQMQGAPATIPTDKRVEQALRSASFLDWEKGKEISTNAVVAKLNKANKKIIESTIRAGYADGATNQEIVSQIVGKRVKNPRGKGFYYRGGYINTAHKRDTLTTVRTVTNSLSQAARHTVWEDNNVKMVEYVATLDNRTTMLCASYDGTRWRLDNPRRPRAPLHYNCRSTEVPVVHARETELETRAARTSRDINEDQITSSKVWQKKRRTERAEVPAGVNYNDFLRGNYPGGEPQPEWFLTDLFGKERANIYLQNKDIDVRNFIRESGARIPLKELKKKYVRAAN